LVGALLTLGYELVGVAHPYPIDPNVEPVVIAEDNVDIPILDHDVLRHD